MIIFEIFKDKLIQIYTKLHHFKKITWGSMPPNPPSFATCKFPNLKNIFLGPPPSPNPGYATVL